MSSALVVCSGGLDSVVLAYMVKEGVTDRLMLVNFDYGQKHIKERICAKEAADRLEATFCPVDLRSLQAVLPSALTDSTADVPEGHYADESMKQTVVPNRNMIMMSIAIGIAVGQGIEYVATAVHAGDHPIYPDCRPEFIQALNSTAQLATEGFAKPGFRVEAPFVNMSKANVVNVGVTVGVPFEKTWSCYKGGINHCGKCGTCVERREAFSIAGVVDPTEYE